MVVVKYCSTEQMDCVNIAENYSLYIANWLTILILIFVLFWLIQILKKKKKKIPFISMAVLLIVLVWIFLLFIESLFLENTAWWHHCEPKNNENCSISYPDAKPVIYLYPEQKQDIKVILDYDWEIFADYPEYNKYIKWWNVLAYPNGNIVNYSDNKEYSYLFWEWKPNKEIDWDLSSWFVVEWNKSRDFLQDILPKIWLSPKEYNEFIVYWYPIMQNNKYNLIHFAGSQYTDYAKLDTSPKYDSMLRVFMVLKPLEENIEIEEQNFDKFERRGLTVIEWGWTVLK